jgi:hypothetical protein
LGCSELPGGGQEEWGRKHDYKMAAKKTSKESEISKNAAINSKLKEKTEFKKKS